MSEEIPFIGKLKNSLRSQNLKVTKMYKYFITDASKNKLVFGCEKHLQPGNVFVSAEIPFIGKVKKPLKYVKSLQSVKVVKIFMTDPS